MKVSLKNSTFEAFQFIRHRFEELPDFVRNYSVRTMADIATLYRHHTQNCVFVPAVGGGHIPAMTGDWLLWDGETVTVVTNSNFKRLYKIVPERRPSLRKTMQAATHMRLDLAVPFEIIERCSPPDSGWTQQSLMNEAPLLPHSVDSAGFVLWAVIDLLKQKELVAGRHLYYFEACLEQVLSLPFVTFNDVAVCLDPRNQWTEDTLLNIARGYPETLPLFRDREGRALFRISDIARYHMRLYGRREFDRSIRFEETLRALTRERSA